MDFSNQVVLVTGGAVGIGRGIATHFLNQNAVVVINYHKSAQAAIQFQAEQKGLGRELHILQADVSNLPSCEQLIEETIRLCGRLDVVVNNSGITRDNLIIRMSEQDFDDVIQTNLKGAWNISKQAIKVMAKQRYGRIINISSVVGLIGSSGQSNYAASKAGLIGLTKSLAREYAKRGITVNCVAPGLIETDMTKQLDSSIIEAYLAQIPMNRAGTVDDVAAAVLFFASKEASYLSGQVLAVDGGLVMM